VPSESSARSSRFSSQYESPTERGSSAERVEREVERESSDDSQNPPYFLIFILFRFTHQFTGKIKIVSYPGTGSLGRQQRDRIGGGAQGEHPYYRTSL
jgi:hypothetical protein